MRSFFDNFMAALGAVAAWGIALWAAHELYQHGFDDGWDAREADAVTTQLSSVPDPEPES